MSKPYESPDAIESVPSKSWKVVLPQLFKPLWLVGTILILTSWLKITGPAEGWAGFVLTIVAIVLSLAFQNLPSLKQREWFTEKNSWAILSTYMLEERCPAYHDSMGQYRNGSPLLFDGLAFALYPKDGVACWMPPSQTFYSRDNDLALHDFQVAVNVFELLKSKSPEFKETATGRVFRVWLVSSLAPSAPIICMIENNRVDWEYRPLIEPVETQEAPQE